MRTAVSSSTTIRKIFELGTLNFELTLAALRVAGLTAIFIRFISLVPLPCSSP